MPHGPAFMFGVTLFAEYVPSICRQDNLYIRKTQCPVVVSTAIETASFLLLSGEYLLQVLTAKLTRRFHYTIELFRCCIAKVSFTMCDHPRLQLVVPIITVLCSTRDLVVIAQEQC